MNRENPQRITIEQQIQEFFGNGGKVEEVEQGKTGAVTRNGRTKMPFSITPADKAKPGPK